MDSDLDDDGYAHYKHQHEGVHATAFKTLKDFDQCLLVESRGGKVGILPQPGPEAPLSQRSNGGENSDVQVAIDANLQSHDKGARQACQSILSPAEVAGKISPTICLNDVA